MASYVTILRKVRGGKLTCDDCGVEEGQSAIECKTPGKDWPMTFLHYVKAQISAHHVIPKKSRPDLEFDVTNMVPLCHVCHAKRHTVTPTWEWWQVVC